MARIKHQIEYSRTQLLNINSENYWEDVITWSIQNIQPQKITNKNVYSEESHVQKFKLPETRFKFKLKCYDRTKGIKIYYFLSSPATVSYKIYFNRKLQNVKIEETNMHCIPANKWLYLATLHSTRNNTPWQQILKSGEVTMVFQCRFSFNDTNVNPLDQLSKDFGQLLCDELFSDVTLKSVEGPEFKVHKYILASRSAVLKAIFEYDTKERTTNIVESPFEADVLQDVLTYIYSNKVLKADEMPDKLLEAADYYQLDGLKRLCTQKLYERLTAENAIDTLQLADRYHVDSLKDFTLQFLKDEASGLLKTSTTWAKIESVPLLQYTCKWLAENNDSGTDENDDDSDTEEDNDGSDADENYS